MTQQRVVELWEDIEYLLCLTVDPLEELFDKVYNGQYKQEHIAIIQKLLSVQEDLTLIEMQKTFKEQSIVPWEGEE